MTEPYYSHPESSFLYVSVTYLRAKHSCPFLWSLQLCWGQQKFTLLPVNVCTGFCMRQPEQTEYWGRVAHPLVSWIGKGVANRDWEGNGRRKEKKEKKGCWKGFGSCRGNMTMGALKNSHSLRSKTIFLFRQASTVSTPTSIQVHAVPNTDTSDSREEVYVQLPTSHHEPSSRMTAFHRQAFMQPPPTHSNFYFLGHTKTSTVIPTSIFSDFSKFKFCNLNIITH